MHRSGPVRPSMPRRPSCASATSSFGPLAKPSLPPNSHWFCQFCDLDARIGGGGAANHLRAKSDAGRDYHCRDAFPNPSQNPNETGTGIPWSVTYIDLDFAIESTMVIFRRFCRTRRKREFRGTMTYRYRWRVSFSHPTLQRARRTAATLPMSSGTAAQ